jgi:hypothetical protein
MPSDSPTGSLIGLAINLSVITALKHSPGHLTSSRAAQFNHERLCFLN